MGEIVHLPPDPDPAPDSPGSVTAYRVNYGTLFALVEADTPEAATGIAKAWRERKFGRRGGLPSKPPKAVLADTYTVRPATERDVEWLARFGGRPFRDMPPVRLVKARHSAVEAVGVARAA